VAVQPTASWRAPLASTSLVLIGVAVVAWIGTIAWALDMGMGAVPGTMGLAPVVFVAVWTSMMAAMMLPSVAPVATLYTRTIRDHRVARSVVFTAGYLVAWAITGVVAFMIAGLFDDLATDSADVAHAVSVVAFAAAGAYQLSPLKSVCLRHCRSPFSHLLHYAAYSGPTRDLRAGLHHGLVCVGCCWMLMVVLIAVGVMNIPAMVGLAVVIAFEKHWRYGELLGRLVGVAFLVWAVLLIFDPGLAPGLSPVDSDMGGMG
jgi:predicted metal-binding membrane protein